MQRSSAGDAAASAEHHARDLGKILLQAQSDLRKIRETISVADGAGTAGKEAHFTAESLQHIVEKVEADLRLKAEAVLNTVVQGGAPTTLPTLGAYNFSHTAAADHGGGGASVSMGLPRKSAPQLRSHSAGGGRPDARARPAAASIAAERHLSAIRNPNSSANRRHLAERFGVSAPASHAPLRPIGRDKPGVLRKERVSKAMGAPPASVRNDPQAVAPIGPKDVAAGLLSLVTRGLLPPNVDLTPAMERRPAPMVQQPARMHDFRTQFAPSNSSAYVSPFGFNVSDAKLDPMPVGAKPWPAGALARWRADALALACWP